MHLTPAYGRDYASRAAVVAALKAGKDFVISDMSSDYDGKPINIVNILHPESKCRSLNVRYGGNRKVAVIKIDELRA